MELYPILESRLLHDLIDIVGAYKKFGGAPNLILDHTAYVTALIMLNTGELASASRNNDIKIWDLKLLEQSSSNYGTREEGDPVTGTLLRSIHLPEPIDHLIIMPSGMLVTGSAGRKLCIVDPWEGLLDTFKLEAPRYLTSMAAFSDTHVICGFWRGVARIFNIKTRKSSPWIKFDDDDAIVTGIVVSETAIIIASNQGVIKVLTRPHLREQFTHKLGYIRTICLLPNDRLACGSYESIFIFNLITREIEVVMRTDGSIDCLVYFPQDYDSRLFSGGTGGIIQGWNINTGMEMVRMEQTSAITALLVLPNGRLASGTAEGVITVWD